MKRETKGLLAIWLDIDEKNRTAFQKWHNCEHMTERVTIPAIQLGRRYRGIEGEPDFLILYETFDSKVLNSAPYQRSLSSPTPWTREALTYFKNTVRTIYHLVVTAGKEPLTDAPYVMTLRFNLNRGSERETIHWYSKEYLPNMCKFPGIYNGRLYEVDEEVSNIMTEERKIYGGGPGQQRFLTLFELGSLDLAKSEVWKEAQKGICPGSMLGRLEIVYKEHFWLDFTMYAPHQRA